MNAFITIKNWEYTTCNFPHSPYIWEMNSQLRKHIIYASKWYSCFSWLCGWLLLDFEQVTASITTLDNQIDCYHCLPIYKFLITLDFKVNLHIDIDISFSTHFVHVLINSLDFLRRLTFNKQNKWFEVNQLYFTCTWYWISFKFVFLPSIIIVYWVSSR